MEGRHACLTPHLDYGTYEKVIQRSYQFGWWMRRKDK